MGKQIRFFRNDEIDDLLTSELSRLGLRRFDQDSGPFFALTDPGDDWLTADAIQYSQQMGEVAAEGRLWTASTTDFQNYFEAVRKFIRSRSSYDKNAQIWVFLDYADEYKNYRRAKTRELNAVIAANREYAVKVLGARPRSDEG